MDDLIKILCKEADDIGISLDVSDKKGLINIREKDMKINPVYWEERDKIFLQKILSYYKTIDSSINIVEKLNYLIKNPENRKYILDYLENRI